MTREERGILRKVKTKPRLSAPKLVAELFTKHEKTVSGQTIRGTIKKQGLNDRVARKNPFINRKLRKEFAGNHLKKDESWWKV